MLSSEQQAEIERLLVQARLTPGLADAQLYMGLAEKFVGFLRTMIDTTLDDMSRRERFIAAFVVAKIVAESLEAVLKEEPQG